ncbi:MAG: hypothetical protein RTV41_01105 [Candidatus Thorarchaeota archaeon]
MSGQKKASTSEGLEDSSESKPQIVEEVLTRWEFSMSDVESASQVLDFVQYLLDDDANLTKSFNLNKAAKDELMQRIIEVFEGSSMEVVPDD